MCQGWVWAWEGSGQSLVLSVMCRAVALAERNPAAHSRAEVDVCLAYVARNVSITVFQEFFT